MGVITTCQLDVGTVFGPLSPNATVVDLSVLIGHRTCDTPPDVHTVTLNLAKYSDNEQLLVEWIPYVHAARHSSEQNVQVSIDHCNGLRSLFYTITRPVAPHHELFVWYSEQLAEELGLPRITESSKKDDGSYCCPDCAECFRYPNSLRAHMRFRCRQSSTPTTTSPNWSLSSPSFGSLSMTSFTTTRTDNARCSPISAAFGDVTNITLPLYLYGDKGNGKRRADQLFDDVDMIKLYKRAVSSSMTTANGRHYGTPNSVTHVTDILGPTKNTAADTEVRSESRGTLHRAVALSGLPPSLSINPPSPSPAISSMSPPGGHTMSTAASTLSPSSIQSIIAAAASFMSTSASSVFHNVTPGSLQVPARHPTTSNENHPYLDDTIRDAPPASLVWQNHGILSPEGLKTNVKILRGNGNSISNSLKQASTCGISDPLTAVGLRRFPFGIQNPLLFGEMLRNRYASSSTVAVSSCASVAAAAALLSARGPSLPSPSLQPVLPVLPPLHLAQNWCAKCNTGFRMTSDLVHHMRTHHKRESIESHVTSEDAATSVVSGSAVKHLPSDSSARAGGKTLLRCEVCHELFRERHHLTRHMTSHS